jgi:hypothetical protein
MFRTALTLLLMLGTLWGSSVCCCTEKALAHWFGLNVPAASHACCSGKTTSTKQVASPSCCQHALKTSCSRAGSLLDDSQRCCSCDKHVRPIAYEASVARSAEKGQSELDKLSTHTLKKLWDLHSDFLAKKIESQIYFASCLARCTDPSSGRSLAIHLQRWRC